MWIYLAAFAVSSILSATTLLAQEQEFTFTVAIGSSTVAVDSESSIQLLMRDIEADPIGAWVIDITYDADIVYLVECFPLANSICETERGPNVFRVTGASATGLTEATPLADIVFRCSDQGESPLTLQLSIGSTGMPIFDVTLEDGSVTCEEAQPTIMPEALPSTGTGGYVLGQG